MPAHAYHTDDKPQGDLLRVLPFAAAMDLRPYMHTSFQQYALHVFWLIMMRKQLYVGKESQAFA